MSRTKVGSIHRGLPRQVGVTGNSQFILKTMTKAKPADVADGGRQILKQQVEETWAGHLPGLVMGGFAPSEPRHDIRSNYTFEISYSEDQHGNILGYWCQVTFMVFDELVAAARGEVVRSLDNDAKTLMQVMSVGMTDVLDRFFDGRVKITRTNPYYDGTNYWVSGFVFIGKQSPCPSSG